MVWNNLRLGLRPQQIIYINHRLNIGFKYEIFFFRIQITIVSSQHAHTNCTKT